MRIAAAALAGASLLGAGLGHPSIDLRSVAAEQAPRVDILLRVQDGRGTPVAGLTAKDFTVYEDGTAISDVTVRQSHPNDKPVAISFLIDTSGSMTPAAESAAAAGAKQILSSLTPDDQAEVVSFSSDITTLSALSNHTDPTVFDRLRPAGNTRLNDAVSEAIDRVATARASARAIIVLTDGKDDGSATRAPDLLAKASSNKVPVYAIGLGKLDAQPLQELAASSNGAFFAAASAGDLADVYSKAASSLLTEYHLSFDSTHRTGRHALSVNVTTTGGTAEASQQFRIGVPPPSEHHKSSTLPLVLALLLMVGGIAAVVVLVRASRRGLSPVPPGPSGTGDHARGSSSAWGSSTSYHLVGDAGTFPVSGPTVVGRDPRADLVIGDETVSRSHARLEEIEGGLWVEDLGSSNGTTLNGRRVASCLAQEGDLLGFGDLLFELRAPR